MSWPIVRLGDVTTTASGSTPPRGHDEYYDGSVPWAKIQDLTRSGMWLHDTGERVSNEAVRDCRLPIFEPGTVLLAMYGSVGIASLAAVPTAANQAILGISPGDELDSVYLWFYLRHRSADLVRLGRGGTQSNINALIVRDMRIPLPQIAEQRRIAARLTGQLAAVARTSTVASERHKLVDRLVQAELARALSIRTGWRTVPLHDVVEIQLGKMLSPASRTGRRPIPYVRNANVQWDRVDLADVAEMDFDEREEAKFALRPGDVLVCEGGEPGRAAVWRGEITRCCYQKALHRLRPLNDAVDPEFLVFTFWLASLRGEFTEDHAKTTIAHLPAVRLRELRVSLPSLSTQRRLASRIRRRLDTIRHLQHEIQTQIDEVGRLPHVILRDTFEGIAE